MPDERRVVVSLQRAVLAQAVHSVLRAHGWRAVDAAPADRVAYVTDDEHLGAGERSVLIVEAAPVSCAAALRRLLRGDVGAVVADERILELPEVLDALRRRRSLLDLDLVALAALVPPLTPREQAVLQGVLAGQSAREIAANAFVSLATVKRSISRLLRVFGVRSTAQLARRAAGLGYRPRAVTGPLP